VRKREREKERERKSEKERERGEEYGCFIFKRNDRCLDTF
jgi:hypothetical protein